MSDPQPTPDSPAEAKTEVLAVPGGGKPLVPHIPDHRLVRCIGSGGYGEVWLAQTALGTYRAVKIVHRHRFESERPYEREFEGIKNFEPISRRHESQVDILHVGRNDTDGYFFYIMELADQAEPGPNVARASSPPAGVPNPSPIPNSAVRAPSSIDPETYVPRTLRIELDRHGRLPLTECLEIGRSLARALEHLHGHRLIHRDIKPGNIVFIDGVAKLADIGLVTETGEAKSFVGTKGYFPPEGPGAPTGDIYSLGKVLYEIVTGRDRTAFPELPAHLDRLPDKAGVLALMEVVLKACVENPRARYADARSLREDLEAIQRGQPLHPSNLLFTDMFGTVLRHRRLLIALAVVVIATLLILINQLPGWKAARTSGGSGSPDASSKSHPARPDTSANAAAPAAIPPQLAAQPAGNVLEVAYTGTPPSPPANASKPSLRFEISAKRKGAAAFVAIRDGDSLASGVDHYCLVAQPLTAGYLYIFQVDASGKVDWLHPANGSSSFASGTNPVRAGQVIQLPSAQRGEEALLLDRNTGIEHIYAVFSAERWTALEASLTRPAPALVSTRSATLATRVQTPNGLRTRGVAGTVKSDTGTVAADALGLERVYEGKTYKLPLGNQVIESATTFLVTERWFKHVNPE